MKLPRAILAAGLAAFPATAFAAPDARAQDAADAFSDLCVSMFIGGKSASDPRRFEMIKIDEATKRQIKPDIKAAALWDVRAKASDASMLVHYEPQGICVVEIAEADENSVQDAVARAAARAASALGTAATAQPVTKRRVEGLIATSASWRFASPRGDVLIMLTSVPEPKFMVQHVVTASYVG